MSRPSPSVAQQGADPVQIVARSVGAALAIAAGVVVAIYANWTADAGGPLASAREALRSEGFNLLLVSVVWLVAGAVFQTPAALLRRARVGYGWMMVAVLVLYHLLVALIAVPVAEIAPTMSDSAGRRDPGAHYGAFLIMVLYGLSLFGVFGGVFPPLERPKRKKNKDDFQAKPWMNLLGVAAISWLGGALALIMIIFKFS
ncbi:hypothetical protein [Actinoplanes utahensis]|uniref:hypothetical protein n=1 Tax=Actinoplanes utahensis TaxID=1869 RepID=UPI00126A74B9|nr:hypothetical protein [Actinoplanes utahensis]GIF33633.1 hypothetical protein Aut01nite_66190 [Actinoplanes utahensis]